MPLPGPVSHNLSSGRSAPCSRSARDGKQTASSVRLSWLALEALWAFPFRESSLGLRVVGTQDEDTSGKHGWRDQATSGKTGASICLPTMVVRPMRMV